MTSRLTSTALDLSKLPAPLVIEKLDEEQLKAAYVERYKVVYQQKFGVPYTVDMLETDSAIEIGEAVSGLRLLDRARVNDAAKAVLLAFATGADLDNIGAFFGVDRMPGEADDRYRLRVQLAPDAYSSTGTIGAYVFHAMTASLLVKNVGVRSPSPGAVSVSLLSSEAGNGTPSNTVLNAVRARLDRKDIKPLTVAQTIQAAPITPIDVVLRLRFLSGVARELVKEEARKSVVAYAGNNHKVGETWTWDGMVAAARVHGVQKVVQYLPAVDVDPGPDGAVFMSSLSILDDEVDP